MKIKTAHGLVTTVATSLLIASCGGGGGGGGGPANQPPTARAGADQLLLAGTRATINGAASSDSDGTISRYRWQQLDGDSVALSASDSAAVNFDTQAITRDQTLRFQLTVTDDDGATATDSVAITVNAAVPVARAGSDRTVLAQSPLQLQGDASSDSGGSISRYSWVQQAGPAVIFSDTTSATPLVSLPSLSSDTELQFALTVEDSYGASDTDTVAITVNLAAPIADAGELQTVGERRSVFLAATASADNGGTISGYQWRQLSGPAVVLSGDDTVEARFVAPSVAGQVASPVALSFELTVTDNLGASDNDITHVSVTNTLIAPIADAGENITVDTTGADSDPVVVTLDGTSSSDPDGTIERYLWTQSGRSLAGIELTDTDQALATVTFSQELTEDVELFFSLAVTDDEDQSDLDTVKVTAMAPPPPVAEYAISGTIKIAPASQLDSDINDSSTTPIANSELLTAQLMPSPAIVGGYVNQPGNGEDGNSFAEGDLYDTYRVTLLAGQSVLLLIGNRSEADLDLWLYSSSGEVVDSSLSYSSNESVVAPADGEYFVEVEAWSGFSNYNLAIGLEQSLPSNGFRLSDAFIPQQLVAEPVAATARAASKLQAQMSALGVSALRGQDQRVQLLQLDDTRSLGGRRAAASRAINASPEQSAKLATLIAAKQLQQSAAVSYAHPNYLREAKAIPNDPRYAQQWHYPLIDLDLAWDITVDTHPSGARVAVIDTGSLPQHPDLLGQFVGGYDFISSAGSSGDGDGIDADPSDPGDGGDSSSSFHGAHVAGTVAAVSNNGLGVTGVAWKTDTKVVPLRVLGEFGGTTYDVVQAIRYAGGLSNDSGTTIAPVDVINLSLGGSGPCATSEQQAFDEVRAAGVLVAVAAGNDSSDAAGFSPANCEGIYTVSAVDATRALAWYSNYGETIELAAPGGDTSRDTDGDGYPDGVLSTLADDSSSMLDYQYTFYQGTSMATPHLAGVLALMKSVNPLLTPAHIDVLIASGAISEDIGTEGKDPQFGWGLINARKAVAAAFEVGGEPPPPLLSVSPRQINLGTSFSQAVLTARNAGSGALEVTDVLSSQDWLTVSAMADEAGLGQYTLTAERDGLAPGSYNATVTFNSSANQRMVEVNMLVVDSDFEPQVGPIYLLLVNDTTDEVVAGQRLSAVEGLYEYRFEEVPEGAYRLIAGSDFDNDQYICDAGEACGRYQTRSNPTVIAVAGGDLNDINFTVEYEVSIAAEAMAAEGSGVARTTTSISPAAVPSEE